MTNYPVEFSSSSEARSDNETWTIETEEGLNTEMSVPIEFGGDNENPSPEDLFSASVQTCVIATFKTIAERKDLEYEDITSQATIKLDRGSDSRPVMKEGKVNIDVSGIEEREKARKVSKATKKNCFIHNSIKTDVKVIFNFE